MELMTSGLREAVQADRAPDSLSHLLTNYIFRGSVILFPLLLTVVIAALLGNVLQIGIYVFVGVH